MILKDQFQRTKREGFLLHCKSKFINTRQLLLGISLSFYFSIIFFSACADSLFAQNTIDIESNNIAIDQVKIDLIHVAKITSSINAGTFEFLKKVYRNADRQGADLVLIEINTPGGLVSDTKRIISLIGQSKIPTAVWVAPEGGSAASAGALIASSAHFIFMARGTNIGAATPIIPLPTLNDSVLQKKLTNDLNALVQSLSEARGRDSKIFSEMILEASSFPASQAIERRLISSFTNSRHDLAEKLDKRTVTILGLPKKLSCTNATFVDIDWSPFEYLVDTLADPNLSYVLLILGIAFIYLEIQTFTGMIAGSIGLLLLVLAAIGLHMIPVNLAAFSLILCSFALFFAEAYITSFGLISLLGLFVLWIGSSFLYDTENSYVSLSQSLILTTTGIIFAVGAFVVGFILRGSKNGQTKADYYTHVGKKAIVSFNLGLDESGGYRYQVKVEGEVWTAQSKVNIETGKSCTITSDADSKMILTIEE